MHVGAREIGALAAVDRAALGKTRIGRGSRLDNLVQVGHSVVIGSDTVLAGQVGIPGSSRIGSRVTLAGQVGVAGHLTVGDGVTATAQTGIPNDVALRPEARTGRGGATALPSETAAGRRARRGTRRRPPQP